MRLAFVVCLFWGFSNANACFVPKKEQRVDARTLVIRSNQIVLAKLKSVQAPTEQYGKAEYTFEVVESIKGNRTEELMLKGHEFQADEKSDFGGHQDKDFWKASGGRARTNADCSVSASFEAGKLYLLFPNEPHHLKGFELISSEKDAWLTKVRKLAKR